MPSMWRRIRDNRKKSKGDDNKTGAFGRLDDSPAELEGGSPASFRAPTRNLPRRNSAEETGGRENRTGLGVRFASTSNLPAAQIHNTTDSPALSRASSLSSTDLDYLNAQAYRESRNNSPKPIQRPEPSQPATSFHQSQATVPQVDWEAFSGAFAPQPRVQQPTRYPISPLTEQQLNDLAGAFAPPAPRRAPVVLPAKKRWALW